MDINSDCVDDCATNCPPSANSCVLPSHSQGLAVIHKVQETLSSQKNTNYAARMSPAPPRAQTCINSSHGTPDTKRPQVPSASEPQTSPAVPTASASGRTGNHGDGCQCYPWEERRAWQNSRPHVRQISKMEQQRLFGIQRICHSSTDTPWLLPALLNLFLLPASSHCWMFAFFPACASFQTHLGLVFNILLMAGIRFHLKDFLQHWEVCLDKIHSVRRPKRRRMPRKGSPLSLLSCGDQPLVWSGKNGTEGMSRQAGSKENIPWPLHSVQVAQKKL